MNNSRKYERNACFYLWLFRDHADPEIIPLPIHQMLLLPLSKKPYKTTLKNVKVYINELLLLDASIVKAELERATHIGSFERRSQDHGTQDN